MYVQRIYPIPEPGAAERAAALDRLGFLEEFHWRPDR